jgi:hypothetical protein
MVRFCFSALLLSLLTASAAAQSPAGYTYTTVTYPQAILTQAHGINNSGWLAGQYTDSLGVTHGFTQIAGTFNSINFPGAALTQVQSINSTRGLAGFYLDKQGLIHGFVEINGSLTTLDVPGAFRTQAYGMNDSGIVVGGYSDSTGQHGFSFNGVNYSTIDLGTQHFTVATGINDAGQIIGYYGAGGGTTLGFLLDTHGQFTTIKTNNAVTEPLGINSSGTIVGIEGTETTFRSFMFQNGRFLPIPVKVPSSFITQAEAVNDSGQIVGWYLFEGSPLEGFTALP